MTRRSLTLVDVFERHARFLAGKVAVIDDASTATYSDLWAASAEVARDLVARGVEPGQPVAVAFDPSAASIAAIVGVMRAGAVACPINTRLAASEIDAYVEALDPALVLAEDPHLDKITRTYADVVRHAAVHESRDLVSRVAPDERPTGRPTALPHVDEAWGAIAFGTGGTTGIPKPALWSHRSLSLAAGSACQNLDVARRDVELYFSPLFHITAVTGFFATLSAGGAVRVLRRFDEGAALRALAEDGITRFFGAPTAIDRMMDADGFGEHDRSGVRAIVYGSTHSGVEFADRVHRGFPAANVYTGYGATEFGAVTRVFPDEWAIGRELGVGRPLPGVDIRIVGSDGHEVAPSERGEIVVSSPWQMDRYLNNPVETAAVTLDGGIRSGDVGVIDADGYLAIVGRSKEMIISGGENVFPVEVERVLAMHPDVAEVAVCGCADPVWGERVEAAVVLASGASADPAALEAHCKQSIAGYKVPKAIHIIDELPYTTNLKLDREKLRSQIEQGRLASGGSQHAGT